MTETTTSQTNPAGFVSPWDEATFDLMVEKFDIFQFGNALKQRQDRLGGIWASEYFPGLFPAGGFLNAAAALSTRGARYGSLEEASSWEAVKETWITSGAPEEELKPFSYALAHVPMTGEQALEFGEYLINKRFAHGTAARRFAHNPVFKDESLYATMLGLDSDFERSLEYSRFKLSFLPSRYAVPSLVKSVLPLIRVPAGNTPAAVNLTSKNPALRELHGNVVQAADPDYMDDYDAQGPLRLIESDLPYISERLEALRARTSEDIKENTNFARMRTLTLIYLAGANQVVRESITRQQEVDLSHNLGRVYLPLILNSEDLMSRAANTTALLALPHVARYVREELNDNGADVDGVPLNWLLELLS